MIYSIAYYSIVRRGYLLGLGYLAWVLVYRPDKAKARELAEKMGAVTSYLDDATFATPVLLPFKTNTRTLPRK
jgi:hypothetical protein